MLRGPDHYNFNSITKAAVELENLRRSYQDELEKINRPAPATAVGQQRTRTGRQTDNHNDLRAKFVQHTLKLLTTYWSLVNVTLGTLNALSY